MTTTVKTDNETEGKGNQLATRRIDRPHFICFCVYLTLAFLPSSPYSRKKRSDYFCLLSSMA